ncbi:hypothetical protein JOC24_002445 [Streptomyces sp. HB132]|nr:hypothetical protein [Streptomyces sp. HB132]
MARWVSLKLRGLSPGNVESITLLFPKTMNGAQMAKWQRYDGPEDWEIANAVEDGVRRAHNLPPRKSEFPGCLKMGAIGCGVITLLWIVGSTAFFIAFGPK